MEPGLVCGAPTRSSRDLRQISSRKRMFRELTLSPLRRCWIMVAGCRRARITKEVCRELLLVVTQRMVYSEAVPYRECLTGIEFRAAR